MKEGTGAALAGRCLMWVTPVSMVQCRSESILVVLTAPLVPAKRGVRIFMAASKKSNL